MSQRSFDYPTFLQRWRAICALYSVDPLEGFSSYQLCHYYADQTFRKDNPDWWKDHHLWGMHDDQRSHEAAEDRGTLYRSTVEQAAIWNSFVTTWGMTVDALEHERREHEQPQEVKQTCPNCDAGAEFQYFWRYNSGGKQYLCRACDRVYTPERGKPIYSDERKEMAYALYEQGLSNYRIAERLHVNRITVSDWLKEFGVIRQSTRQQFPKEIREQAFQLNADGWSSRQIGRELGVDPRLVRSWISKARRAPMPEAS